MLPVFCCIILNFVLYSHCAMEPKIEGGERSKIIDFPYSAALRMKCMKEDLNDVSYFTCGSSIINQVTLLTAAHCLDGCSYGSHFLASVGHSHRLRGASRTIVSYMTHEQFHTFYVEYDIGLARVKIPLKFSPEVARIALVREPPYFEPAQIAGWGYINEIDKIKGNHLKNLTQYVRNKTECLKILKSVAYGTICASSGKPGHFPAGGDSGSALVVRGYIQVGLVSFKLPNQSRSTIVYTDTGLFYNWIVEKTKQFLCYKN